MATLGNILERKAGVPMTGRPVKLTLAVALDGGVLHAEQAEAVLMPVSLPAKARAFADASAYIEKCRADAAEAAAEAKANGGVCVAPTIPSETDERAFRLMLASLRDPDNARRAFVEAKHTDRFRAALINEQLRYLLSEYDEMIATEYPEIASWAEAERMRDQAAATF